MKNIRNENCGGNGWAGEVLCGIESPTCGAGRCIATPCGRSMGGTSVSVASGNTRWSGRDRTFRCQKTVSRMTQRCGWRNIARPLLLVCKSAAGYSSLHIWIAGTGGATRSGNWRRNAPDFHSESADVACGDAQIRTGRCAASDPRHASPRSSCSPRQLPRQFSLSRSRHSYEIDRYFSRGVGSCCDGRRRFPCRSPRQLSRTGSGCRYIGMCRWLM